MGASCLGGDGTTKTKTEKWDSNTAKGILIRAGADEQLKRQREDRKKRAKAKGERAEKPPSELAEEDSQFIRVRPQQAVPSVAAISTEEPDAILPIGARPQQVCEGQAAAPLVPASRGEVPSRTIVRGGSIQGSRKKNLFFMPES